MAISLAKWREAGLRRGDRILSVVSSRLSMATAVAFLSLPFLPQVATRWGPAAPVNLAMMEPATRNEPIAVVKTRPLAAPEGTEVVPAEALSPPPAATPLTPSAQASSPLTVASKAAPPTPPPAKTAEPSPPPASETWSDADVAGALKACVQLLGPIAASVETLAPIRQDKCGTPAPVSLKRVGAAGLSVEMSPPAIINCPMVAKLSDWVEKIVQPAAKDLFGASVVRFNSASGYVCRGRNGDTMANGKISEHALANALDVASFTLSDGRIVDVGKHWGPTHRDKPQAVPAPAAEKAAPAALPPPAKSRRGAAQVPEALKPEPARMATSQVDDASLGKEAQFLRRLHKGACAMFGTVLGPEANEAHREHFHLDLHPRRQSAYCQ